MSGKINYEVGQLVNGIEVVEDLGRIYPTDKSKQKTRMGLFKCPYDGNIFKTTFGFIKSGHTCSCGCLHSIVCADMLTTHGKSKSNLYSRWCHIKNRCYKSNNKDFVNYGGRGITMCDEWRNDFMSFYNWAMANGYSEELTIERKNNDGNYEPSNCKWATVLEQANNQRISSKTNTGYYGVYAKGDNKFGVQLRYNKKSKHIGYYSNITEAAIAYNNYIINNGLLGKKKLNIIP